MKVYTCEYLERALVQWRNMAVHKYENAKITKSQDPCKFQPAKIEVYMASQMGGYCNQKQG